MRFPLWSGVAPGLLAGLFMNSAGLAQETKVAPVMAEDFEGADPGAEVWVGDMPKENATISIVSNGAQLAGKSLKLHYAFTGGGQHLGVTIPVQVKQPIKKLRFMLKGDGSGYGVYLIDAGAGTFKYRDAAKMKIDFEGWKEIEIDNPESWGERWGGDGHLDYPLRSVVMEISTPGHAESGDLSPYNGIADMYVDYVQVYQGEEGILATD